MSVLKKWLKGSEMNVNKIEVGDVVQVQYGSDRRHYLFMTVLDLPSQGAEYWIMKQHNNQIIYVGFNFARIILWTKKDHVGTTPLEDYTREKYQESNKGT